MSSADLTQVSTERLGHLITGQHLLVQLPQFGTRLDAELVDKEAICSLVGGQRLGPPPGMTQGDQQSAPQVFSRGILYRQRAERRNDDVMLAECDVGIQQVFTHGPALFLQLGGLGLPDVHGQFLEGVTAPQFERRVEVFDGPARIAVVQRVPPAPRRFLEQAHVEFPRIGEHPVCTGTTFDPISRIIGVSQFSAEL
nr:hypothetical protein [Kibdelosporangium aridum]